MRNLERLFATLRQDARPPAAGPPVSTVRRTRAEVLRSHGRMSRATSAPTAVHLSHCCRAHSAETGDRIFDAKNVLSAELCVDVFGVFLCRFV